MITLTILVTTAMICSTIGFVVLMLAGGGRDISARDRDRGLAKLYEARANLMFVEELERRAVLRIRDAEEHRLHEARERRRREAACEEVKQS